MAVDIHPYCFMCLSEHFSIAAMLSRNLSPKRHYDPHQLELAVEAVKAGTMTQSKAARVFGVPQTTISGRLKRLKL